MAGFIVHFGLCAQEETYGLKPQSRKNKYYRTFSKSNDHDMRNVSYTNSILHLKGLVNSPTPLHSQVMITNHKRPSLK